jgi:ABC-type enterochelin transport system permease subunit
VPQSSILGHLLFILYINDLPNASRIVEPLLFADDTSICYSHSDPVVLAAVLNEALQSIGSWMRANKLSVNIDKTDYVIFHSRHKKVSYDISLSCDDKGITGGFSG